MAIDSEGMEHHVGDPTIAAMKRFTARGSAEPGPDLS
ncbi:hypothetical protein KZ820_19250 [Sphingomonas sp. RRHST34]|uniref:Uncharacterized protein n=1 Tax=Sphingomonas citri TaxID=2862499 RepID=A0ABS7BTF5_9SPHN|nr:hypothetical protein [Sphingomonas citri]